MGSEDFSYVLQRIPGAMTNLGTRPDTGLFEANDGRTLVMTAAAVRASARDGRVTLTPPTAMIPTWRNSG